MPERSRILAANPFHDRQPTSHERLTGLPWDASYTDGPTSWDTGRPQPAIVRLAAGGGFAGTVLDVGCGTGENTLHLASQWLPVLGIDVAPTALAIARAKAAARSLEAEFAVADALHLEDLGRSFDTVLDSALFHTFDDDERRQYATSLTTVLKPGGTLHLLCFSDDGPGPGPQPISRQTLHATFNPATGWEVAAFRRDRLQTRQQSDHGAPAWLVTINRI